MSRLLCQLNHVFSVLGGTPSGFRRFCSPTQGSSFLATLGWRTQSLWDCKGLNTYRRLRGRGRGQLFVFSLFLLGPAAFAATFTASLERDTITLGENVTLS